MALFTYEELQNIETKHCPICKKEKLLKEFNRDTKNKDGLHTYCRECDKDRKKAYYRTKEGLLNKLVSNQIKSSARRGLPKPTYSKEEFKDWLFNNKDFDKLFKQWEKENYDVNFTPSIDRIDDYKPYDLKNIQLMTWKENNDRARADRKSGKNNKVNIAVNQYTLEGEYLDTFHSVSHASRETNTNLGNLISAAKGNYKSAGGFLWRYESMSKKERLSLEDFEIDIDFDKDELLVLESHMDKLTTVLDVVENRLETVTIENLSSYENILTESYNVLNVEKVVSLEDLFINDDSKLSIVTEEKKNIVQKVVTGIKNIISKLILVAKKLALKLINIFKSFDKKIEALKSELKDVSEDKFNKKYDDKEREFISDKLGSIILASDFKFDKNVCINTLKQLSVGTNLDKLGPQLIKDNLGGKKPNVGKHNTKDFIGLNKRVSELKAIHKKMNGISFPEKMYLVTSYYGNKISLLYGGDPHILRQVYYVNTLKIYKVPETKLLSKQELEEILNIDDKYFTNIVKETEKKINGIENIEKVINSNSKMDKRISDNVQNIVKGMNDDVINNIKVFSNLAAVLYMTIKSASK